MPTAVGTPSPRSSRSSRSSLWRDADFRRFWAGETASQLGEQAGRTILPLLAVVALHSGPGRLGALRAVEQAPILLFSLLIGVWVDRRRSRRFMVLADLGRAAVLAAVPLAYLFGGLGLPLLLVVAFLTGSLSACFDVAYQATLVRLVPRDRLTEGNSALEGSRSAAQIGGPALGGGLVSLLSAPVAVAGCVFFFALSALSIRRIRRPEPRPARAKPVSVSVPASVPVPGSEPTSEPVSEPAAGLWWQIRDGLRLVAGDPALRAVGTASGLFQFSFAALMTVYLLFLPRALHLSGGAVGLVLAATGPGALVGSALSARLPARIGYGVVLVGAAALADGAMLCVPALHGSGAATLGALMAINFVYGAFSQLVNVTTTAVRQAVTPLRLQGRVVATINVVGMGLGPFGSLTGGGLAARYGLRAALLATAAAMTLSPLYFACSPLARLGRNLPDPPDDQDEPDLPDQAPDALRTAETGDRTSPTRAGDASP
ncbi:MFS transporter [Streptomyces sp. NPDC088194]|uniref:MFS transporter n=1 Tax=Streptomyces sp. NPDC088194 TaxID=3154931 RepID=UPI00344DC46A